MKNSDDWNIQIKLLPAYSGDCILFQYKDFNHKIRNILIDGGEPQNYSIALYDEIIKIYKTGQIDLLVITHIDNDHVGGILEFIQDNTIEKKVNQYWFNASKQFSYDLNLDNSNNLSFKQGIKLENYLSQSNNWHKKSISNNFSQHRLPDIAIEILSPDIHRLQRLNKPWKHELKKIGLLANDEHSDYSYSIEELIKNKSKYDRSTTNGSSISFYLDIYNKRFLFLADTHITLIQKNLTNLGYNEKNKLKVECIKLSHHGSKYNLDDNFLKLIDCNKYIICSDGTHGLPHKETLARIAIQKNITFIFNNKIPKFEQIFTSTEKSRYNIKSEFVDSEYLHKELVW